MIDLILNKIRQSPLIRGVYQKTSLWRIYHFGLALLGALFYCFPSRKIFVLGVTGTKGKSTVLELIGSILETAGKKIALLSSVRIKIGDNSKKNSADNTMPGRFFIQRFLSRAVGAGCQYALIEVTSQGILQYRHCFINWQAAIFTNLSPEHIEAHGSFEKYREAKTKFFEYLVHGSWFMVYGSPLFFINNDDESAQYFIEAARGGKITPYSKSDILESRILIPKSLIGDFNLENIAAAAAFAKSQGISDEIIKKAIENFPGVPGRMEFVRHEPFAVVIDYAHTPSSLEQVYQTLKRANPKSQTLNPKLICVLGSAGGGRDRWKRPEMGKIAAQHCDETILTNEDPYDENPESILCEIEAGFSQIQNSRLRQGFRLRQDFGGQVGGQVGGQARLPAQGTSGQAKSKIQNFYKILDRKEAIKKAISLAEPGDTVIITGKGSESWIHLAKGQKIPWNEREIVEKALKEGFIKS